MSATDDRASLVPLALCGGVAAISFAAVLFRAARPTPPLTEAAIRLGVAAVLLAPFVIRAARRNGIDRRFVGYAALAGVFYSLHFGTWVSSLAMTSVAASVTLVTATPLLLALWAVISGVDRPDRTLWFALALATVGVATIGGVDIHGSPGALAGYALALGGAAAMAGYMLVVRRLGAIDVFAFTAIAAAAGCVILVAAGLATGVDLHPASPTAMGYLVLAALVPQLIGHSSLTWSLRHTSPTTVGIATLGEPVGATILTFFWFGEVPQAATVVGCVVTLCAVALALLATRSRRSRP